MTPSERTTKRNTSSNREMTVDKIIKVLVVSTRWIQLENKSKMQRLELQTQTSNIKYNVIKAQN